MKASSKKVIYTTVLLIAVISNYSFGQSAAPDFASKLHITTMAVLGDNIFAGTKSIGVYRSVDGGQVWAAANNGLPNASEITGMAAKGKNIFITASGSESKGMYLSDDYGMNWKAVNPCPGACKVVGLTSFKNKIFVATSDGLYESTDDGLHWGLVPQIVEKNMTALVATDERVLVWSAYDHYTNIFYSTTDGKEWKMMEDKSVMLDRMEVHGDNIVAEWCQNTELRGDGKSRCLANHLRILSKNGKKWEDLDLKPREFGFVGDNIYAITVDVTENRKNVVSYERNVLVSENRGKSWKKVDENTDPVILSDFDMQQKLTELKVWEPTEIAEREAMLKKQKLAAEEYAAAKAKALKAQRELEAKYVREAVSNKPGTMGGTTQPDYRALSQDRYNARHNTHSYMDSQGKIHIR